jgi:hypothetical protein
MGLSSATISTCKTFLRKSTEARAHAKALGSILRTTKKKKKRLYESACLPAEAAGRSRL